MNKRISIGFFVLAVTSLTAISSLAVWSGQKFTSYTEPIAGSELSIAMVAIQGGTYLAGSPEGEAGRKEDEGPRHSVEVSDFWMSTLEITWDQFELFLYRETDDELSTTPAEIELAVDGVAGATMPYVNFNKPGYPLINVTQYAASTFCMWLSAKTGRFYRLPTEAEWEYANRAGSQTPYPFTGSLDDNAWYIGNSGGKLQEGGQKPANAWGLFDMQGNAAEWVLDGYNDKAYAKRNGAADPWELTEKLYPRVVRGGSFQDPAENLRSASRQFSKPDWKKRDPQVPKSLWWLTDAMHVGFRIVRPRVVPPKEDWEKYWGKPIQEY